MFKSREFDELNEITERFEQQHASLRCQTLMKPSSRALRNKTRLSSLFESQEFGGTLEKRSLTKITSRNKMQQYHMNTYQDEDLCILENSFESKTMMSTRNKKHRITDFN